MNANPFAEMAQLAAEQTSDATAEQLARAELIAQRNLRADRLSDTPFFAGPAITPADRKAIVMGTLNTHVHALRLVMAWHEQFRGLRPGKRPPFLVLLGPTGRGKTVAGAWLIAQEGGKYVSAIETSKRICTKLPRDANWTVDVLGARVLVLDDVGTEPESERDSYVAAMYEVVNRRQSLERAFTLITSNLTKEDFEARYGERTMGRLVQSGVFAVAKGDDLRRKE